jgi:hypothetical protein
MSETPSLGHLAVPLIHIPSHQMVIRRYRKLNKRNIRTFFDEGLFSRHIPTYCDDNEGLIERPAENTALRASAVAIGNRKRRRRGLPELSITQEEFKEQMTEFHAEARNKYFANCWRLGTSELDRIWKGYTGDEKMIEGFAFETTVGQFIRALPTIPDDADPDEKGSDGLDFTETPVEEMYPSDPQTDMHIGAVRYQVRDLPSEVQPTGYQSAINFFKGSGYDHEIEFRFLFNPFDSSKLIQFDKDARPVGAQPEVDQEYRYFPMDTRDMVDRIVLAPNAGDEQRERIESILDELGVTYGPGEEHDLEIVEANSEGRPLHETRPYAAELDGTDNYEGTTENLNQAREEFVNESDPDVWPVLDLVELNRERAGTIIEGYRHPTEDPCINMSEYGHDGYQAVVVNRVCANGGTDEYLNDCAEERFGTSDSNEED